MGLACRPGLGLGLVRVDETIARARAPYRLVVALGLALLGEVRER